MDEKREETAVPDLEHLWQFAGQGLRSSDFTAAMVHFYRGELSRSNSWRTRLDATTNWAVITTGAALTFVFGDVNNTPLVLLIDSWLVLLFLFIEARRYRYYELWTYRVRIMETNFFSGLLSPPFLPHTRTYAPIFIILALSWIGKVYLHPVPKQSVEEFLNHAAVGPISGWTMIIIGLIFNGLLIAIGLFTVGLRKTTGEVLGEQSGLTGVLNRLQQATWEVLETDIPILTRFDPRKQLAYIITDHFEEIGGP